MEISKEKFSFIFEKNMIIWRVIDVKRPAPNFRNLLTV